MRRRGKVGPASPASARVAPPRGRARMHPRVSPSLSLHPSPSSSCQPAACLRTARARPRMVSVRCRSATRAACREVGGGGSEGASGERSAPPSGRPLVEATPAHRRPYGEAVARCSCATAARNMWEGARQGRAGRAKSKEGECEQGWRGTGDGCSFSLFINLLSPSLSSTSAVPHVRAAQRHQLGGADRRWILPAAGGRATSRPRRSPRPPRRSRPGCRTAAPSSRTS